MIPIPFKTFFTRTITALLLVIGIFSILTYAPKPVISILILVLFAAIIIREWQPIIQKWSPATIFLTLGYLAFPCLTALWLIHQPLGTSILLFLLLIAGSFDTGAYIAGSLVGRHLCAPSISPRKTWEGTVGGYIAALTASLGYCITTSISASYSLLFFHASIISVLACVGDLFESYLKRRVNIKDSGSLLPGHGGLLDRIDSHLFVVVYGCIAYQSLLSLFAYP